PNYFILLGLSNDPQLPIFLFLMFLAIYLITLVGNMVIMGLIRADPCLSTPMYFFLFHLSLSDISFSSVTVPTMLMNSLAEVKRISVPGCIAQIFFSLLAGGSEVFILAAMAQDQDAAICDPLHYMRIMNKDVCCQLVMGAWILGFIYASINALPLLNVHFCGPNKINHFSCELPPLLDLSCTETFSNKLLLHTSAMLDGLITFSFNLVSYIHIISTILRIRSTEGRHKAFSTCSSHLTVVVLFYGTGLFRCLRPNLASSEVMDTLFSIQYSILTPMLNPIIYSLKNKEVKASLGKISEKFRFLSNKSFDHFMCNNDTWKKCQPVTGNTLSS
ncbi:olfactory receptor 8S1-like, partial [Emydura macquarii macquarii]|uniref:olfactory receptor 8S1-like n=1 Tax=Emydura macquarii macquarii TaxID=1129001 RepID=UPI00352BA317